MTSEVTKIFILNTVFPNKALVATTQYQRTNIPYFLNVERKLPILRFCCSVKTLRIPRPIVSFMLKFTIPWHNT